MRGVGGRKALGKLRTGNCVFFSSIATDWSLFLITFQRTHTKSFFLTIGWQWSKFTDSASFFRSHHHHHYYGRVFVHTLTQRWLSHTHQELKISLTWPPLLSMCNFTGIAKFGCIFHEFPAHKNCFFVGICPAPHGRHTQVHTHMETQSESFFSTICLLLVHSPGPPPHQGFFWESPIDRCFFHPSAGSHISGLVTCKKGSTSSDLRVPANEKCCWTISLGRNAFPNWEFRSKGFVQVCEEQEQGKSISRVG